MILSKLHVGCAAILAGAIAFGLAWEVRHGTQLRTKAGQQYTAAAGSAAALEQQVAVQSQRVVAAEATVAALLEKAKVARSARAAAVSRGASVPVNADDAASAAMARASQLLKDGNQQEALDEYIKSYRELQAIRPGSSACQRLMGAIKSLGRTNPEALSALASLRDSAMAEREAQPDRRELLFEIALLNERLGQGSRTLALYDALPANDPNRRSLAMIANPSFIEARRYADALIGKPFGQVLTMIEAGAQHIARQDISRQALMRKGIVDVALTQIEVLTGAGKLEDARVLTEKLFVFDQSYATRAGLEQHLARAQALKR